MENIIPAFQIDTTGLEDTVTLVYLPRSQKLQLVVANEWAGDSETGFGEAGEVSLDSVHVAGLIAHLQRVQSHMMGK